MGQISTHLSGSIFHARRQSNVSLARSAVAIREHVVREHYIHPAGSSVRGGQRDLRLLATEDAANTWASITGSNCCFPRSKVAARMIKQGVIGVLAPLQ